MTTRLFFILMLLIVFFVSSVLAGEEGSLTINNAKSHWTFLGGYGGTHPGFGATRTRVENVDLILQYGRFLSEEVGKSWYRGRHEILVEVPFSAVYHPMSAIMTGMNFLACWDFTVSEKMVPYILAGGGFVYTNLDIRGLGREFNGNYQAGFGLRYLIKDRTSIEFNYRLHHISNASTADPNEPLNSSKILFGISFLK
jgi:lipid A 3-O-deacylase